MSATHPQHQQDPGYQEDRQQRLCPQYQQGQHVRLPDGTHAHVLTQRGMTLWLRHNDDTITTRPADTVAPAGPGDQISTSAQD